MELQQLRYVLAVYEHSCNVSLASRRLHASQPGLTRQIRLLEKEVGFAIFDRSVPKHPRPTPAGRQLLSHAERMLREANLLRRDCDEHRAPGRGTLAIAASDPETREILPAVIKRFAEQFPGVSLHLHQGSVEQVSELLRRRRVDVAITTHERGQDATVLWLPCFRWQHQLIVTEFHPLASNPRPSLGDLARFPLITAPHGPAGRPALEAAFETSGLAGRIAITARSRDVIETYVARGLGIGVVASCSPAGIAGLRVIDASHLFEATTTWVGVPRGVEQRPYAYAFMELLAPHLTQELVAECAACDDQVEVDRALEDLYVRLLG